MLIILAVVTVIAVILLSLMLGFLVLIKSSQSGSPTGQELEFDSVDNSIIAAQKGNARVETPETSLLFSEMITLQSSMGEVTVLERKSQSHSLMSRFRSPAEKKQRDARRLRQAQEELQRTWQHSIEFDETDEMSTLLDDSQRRPSAERQPPAIKTPPPTTTKLLRPTPSLATPRKAPSKEPARVFETGRRREEAAKGKADKASRPGKPAKGRPSEIAAGILYMKERTRSEIIGVEPEAMIEEGIPLWLGPTAPLKKPAKPKRIFRRKGRNKHTHKRGFSEIATDWKETDSRFPKIYRTAGNGKRKRMARPRPVNRRGRKAKIQRYPLRKPRRKNAS
ncbi:uncharacterized protein [Scyliorhinus torazame]|uniref:uncharacterized protein isoform X2 n=1 Tax=Scyliorhinus torazame TaxID=75743 RepID=UPI003B5CB32C